MRRRLLLSMQNAASATVPRRWNVEADGIKWIPRMADKARMREGAGLGAYLMGHSPVDRSLLRVLGMTTEEWVAMVATTTSDAGVLAKLRARGVDEARLLAWSAKFETRFKALIPLWDLDEGYVTPTPVQRTLLAVFKPVEGLVTDLLRRLRPAP